MLCFACNSLPASFDTVLLPPPPPHEDGCRAALDALYGNKASAPSTELSGKEESEVCIPLWKVPQASVWFLTLPADAPLLDEGLTWAQIEVAGFLLCGMGSAALPGMQQEGWIQGVPQEGSGEALSVCRRIAPITGTERLEIFPY